MQHLNWRYPARTGPMHESQDGGSKSGDADLVAGDQARPREGISSVVGVCTVLRIKRPYRPMAPHTPNFDPLDPGPLKLRLPSRVPLNIMCRPLIDVAESFLELPRASRAVPHSVNPGRAELSRALERICAELGPVRGSTEDEEGHERVTRATGSQDHASQSSSQTPLSAVAAGPIDRSTRS